MSIITYSQFQKWMEAFSDTQSCSIAVAVSGGADSLCLTWMLKQWIDQNGGQLIALTIDHGLRPESLAEATAVQKQMKQWNITHEILTWQGAKPSTRVEEKARQKRYDLIQEYCAQHHIDYLFVGHHQQDQAETFWLRLARGSGIDGLAAMAPRTQRGDLTICRPFLSASKQDIIDTLKKNKIKWVEDPMNQDAAYERVRWRKAQASLDALGLNTNHICHSVQRLARAKNALDFYTGHFLNTFVQIHPQGYAQIDAIALCAQPLEIRIRVLGSVINIIGQSSKPLSLEAVETLANTLPRHATLGECQLVTQKGILFIAKESARMEKAASFPAGTHVWDRFIIVTPHPIKIQAKAPTPRQNLPFLAQRSFPHVEGNIIQYILNRKELEKTAKIAYKENKHIVFIHFIF